MNIMNTNTPERPAATPSAPDSPAAAKMTAEEFSAWLKSAPQIGGRDRTVSVDVRLPLDDWLAIAEVAAIWKEPIGAVLVACVNERDALLNILSETRQQSDSTGSTDDSLELQFTFDYPKVTGEFDALLMDRRDGKFYLAYGGTSDEDYRFPAGDRLVRLEDLQVEDVHPVSVADALRWYARRCPDTTDSTGYIVDLAKAAAELIDRQSSGSGLGSNPKAE